jgi:anti-anti-sigma factor
VAEVRYCLSGDFDQSVAAKVRNDLQVIVRAGDAHLVIDCTQLTFIDWRGIAILLEANRDLEEQGRHMLIANVPPPRRSQFRGLGLSDLLRSDRRIMSNVVYMRRYR